MDLRELKSAKLPSSKPIIFFDGDCLFCNKWVEFLLVRDHGKFSFAPLQGETAKQYLPKADRENLSSLILLRENFIIRSSDAVIEIFVELGGAWGLMTVLRIFPGFLRNFVYRLVAQMRHKLLVKNTCRLLSESEKKRFLP